MEIYKHKVQYYETDKMGVTHHSNYIRWMEESRTDFLEQIGWPFNKLEDMGLISPISQVSCRYKSPSYFSDTIDVHVKISKLTHVKMIVDYVMTNQDGVEVCEGSTELCFLNQEGRIIKLSRDYPEFYNALKDTMQE